MAQIKTLNENGEILLPRTVVEAITDSNGSTLENLLNGKVDKVDGKNLSSNDFTDTLKTRLENTLSESEIEALIAIVQSELDTLVDGNASSTIDTFNEIKEFLDGFTDTEDLSAVLLALKNEIIALVPSIEGLATEDYVSNAIDSIPAVDLSNYVQTTDSRLSDSRPASDVSAWAKEDTKPTYTASEVGALPNTTVIPSIEGLATEDYVSNAIDSIPAVDLSDYYTKTQTDSKFVETSADMTIGGQKTFSMSPIIPDANYDNEAVNRGYVNTQLATKVDKVDGKELSSNDFTDALKTRLESTLSESEIEALISIVQSELDTLVSGDTSSAIDTFNEIKGFLDGFTDTEDLSAVLLALKNEIITLIPSVPSWALESSKPSYDYSEISNTPTIPSISGLATEDYVSNAIDSIPAVDLSGYVLTTDSRLSDSRPASDVSAWAKANTKPTYTANEVGALPSTTELFDGDYNSLSNTPAIPSVSGLASEDYVDNALSDKVDKVAGKDLSSNDYTTTEKNKLAGIEAGAEVNNITTSDDADFDFEEIVFVPSSTLPLATNYDGTTDMQSGVNYIYESNAATVTFSLASVASGKVGIYSLTIPIGDTVPAFSYPNNLIWVNGELSLETNTTYELNILNGVVIYISYSNE